MSLASIESVLEMTAAQISPRQPHYSSLIEDDGTTPKRTLPNWIIRPVQKEIEETAELSEFVKGWIRTPDGGQGLSARNVAAALVFRLFAGIEPKQIVSDILDLSRSNECRTCTYVGLYGGGISGEIELDDSIIAMAADKSPPSAARDCLHPVRLTPA